MHEPPATRVLAAREARRLRALRRYRILDTAPEVAFDDLTRLAARDCGTPLALLGLVDATRTWFKSAVGTSVCSCPREATFCTHALHVDGVFVVPDADRDQRFADRPSFVEGEPPPRFYAGAPLRTTDGHALGTLSVLDQHPRACGEETRATLLALGRQAMAQMELRRTQAALLRESRARERAQRTLRESETRFHGFMNHGPAIAYIKDEEGRFLYVNEPLARAFERPVEDWLGRTDFDMIDAEAAQQVQEHDLTVFNTEEMVVTQEIVATPSGGNRFWLSYKFLLRGADGQKRLGGLSFDMSDRKATESEHERLIAELREALTQVKTLSGFIPICASCKNIRDDAGYWQQIEQYLCKHSDLEFTHGICPACLEKLYPEFAARQRRQSPGPGLLP